MTRLLRDTPGAFRARLRMQGVGGTIKAIPEMTRFALRQYVHPALRTTAGNSTAFGGMIDAYDAWRAMNHWTPARAEDLRRRLSEVAPEKLPLISVVMPTYNTPKKWLDRAIESVCEQVYPNWELCIADDASTDPEVRRNLEAWARRESRIRLVIRDRNGHISQATNSAAQLAKGEFLAFLDHDDELTPDALGEVAIRMSQTPEADVLYSDDDKINEAGYRYHPQFKGEYSPELLLSFMYFCHLMVIRKRIFDEVGGARVGFEGAQDFDLALRAVERSRKIVHLPMVLYHWRAVQGSTARSGGEKPASFEAGRKAVQEALDRRGIKAIAAQPEWAVAGKLGIFECQFPDDGPSVTIVIPTRNRLDLLKRCVESLRKISYRNYSILIVDNESDDPATMDYLKQAPAKVLRVASPGGRFSFAHLNNRAAEACDSDYILLLNNDTEVFEPRWLSQMMGHAQVPGVGSVGAKLLYGDDRVQHAGVMHGLHNGLAGHAFKLSSRHHPGYLNQASVSRNVCAVTAACMLTPRKLYLELGGLDETNFAVAYNDVDYGWRLMAAGYRNVYCASAVLRHHEGATRGFVDNPREVVAYRQRYGKLADPFHNPNLSLVDENLPVTPRRLHRGERKLKRVMYISHQLTLTGGPLIQAEIARQLKQRHGVETVVYSPEDGPLAERYRRDGAEVIIGRLFYQSLHTGKATYADTVTEIAETIRKSGVDAVYTNTILGFWGAVAATQAGVASIWNIHESEGIDHYLREMGTFLGQHALASFRLPYRVVFGSHATMGLYQHLQTHHNFVATLNSVDTGIFEQWRGKWTRQQAREQLGLGDAETAFVTVGTICERKGQMDLAKAFESLPANQREKTRCFLVGDVPNTYSQQIADHIAKWPEAMRQRFRVVRETGDVGLYYRAGDVFVCSSRVECFPRVNLEAMHMGLPILTTPIFGIPEQVYDKVNGLYYRGGQVHELAGRMEQMIDDVELRRRLAENSVQVAKSLPSDADVADAYYQMLHEGFLSRM